MGFNRAPFLMGRAFLFSTLALGMQSIENSDIQKSSSRWIVYSVDFRNVMSP